MVFKFTADISLDEARSTRSLKKGKTFNNKIIFVNGFGGSGKTMISPIISSMDNVESLIFPYEIQWISSFLYSQQIQEDAYVEFLKQYADHTIYNQMMGRNSNFRLSDVSSVLQSKKKINYIRRIFQKGDNHVVEKIKQDKPILNYTTSHLTFFINEIGKAYGERVLFIETFRDPMYMFKQAKINHEQTHLKNLEKHFTFEAFKEEERSFFFDYFSKDKKFNYNEEKNTNLNIVTYFEKVFNFYFKLSFEEINMNGGKIIILPFEKFVLNPDIWINEIIKILKIKRSKNLENELKKQKVPRKFLQQGFSRPVYERFGNKQNKKKYNSFAEADKHYKEEVILEFIDKNNKMDKDLFQRLEKISDDYREWINKFNKQILFG